MKLYEIVPKAGILGVFMRQATTHSHRKLVLLSA